MVKTLMTSSNHKEELSMVKISNEEFKSLSMVKTPMTSLNHKEELSMVKTPMMSLNHYQW